VLQQFDEPRAFYERPRTAGIARFFRNSNFLAGTKRGHAVDTALGTLSVANADALPDGPVTLTVRPEDVQIGTNSPNNRIDATVRATVYMGTHTQFQLDVGGQSWQAMGPAGPGGLPAAQAGDVVSIHLSESRIWLLPGE
jgi:ABC-type Fe3+/spermidine/putrescine transport system ATPase subunit